MQQHIFCGVLQYEGPVKGALPELQIVSPLYRRLNMNSVETFIKVSMLVTILRREYCDIFEH